MFGEMGRLLMLVGAGIFVLGIVLFLLERLPGMGRLPGDLVFQRGNFTVFAPCGMMILLSILLTLVVNIVIRILR